MAAANTDKLRKLSRRWVSQIGSGGVADAEATTIPLSSTTNLPTDTAVTLVIDRVDANGTATPTSEETIVGVVSGTNIVNAVRGVEGTAQAHSAGAVVEVLVTADGYNDIIDHLLVEHGQDGKHTKVNGNTVTAGTDTVALLTASQTLTNKTLTSPKINEDVALTATATELNKLDNIVFTNGAWTAFTPDWINVTEGSATNAGAYCQIGKTILFRAKITFAADTSVSGNIGLILPVTIKSSVYDNIGQAYFTDSGTGNFEGRITSGGSVMCLNAAGTYIVRAAVTATVPFTWTTNDSITVTGFYEAA